jgi:peptidoglycan hydrolase-like protein with peptidoglycan-binding domain
VRERGGRAAAARAGDVDDVESSVRVPFWLMFMLRRPADSFAGIVAAFAASAILVNALFLQSGPHPAPIFANRPPPAPIVQPKLYDTRSTVPVAKPHTDIVVTEIQRELVKRGFYDGPADGVYGAKTDSAIRDFEQAAGLTPSAEPNDVLLQTINRSQIKAKPQPAVRNNDPIAQLLAPNARITAVQRALAEYGYGQIRSSGVYDLATRSAIERFERERNMPVSGQISDRLVRELSAQTGRPLE